MKPINYFVLLFLLGFIISCDKIKKPLEKEPEVFIIGCGDSLIVKTKIGSLYRKVLLEDYTGHKCGNCPAAAIEAENIINTYQDSVIVLAVHAGSFANAAAAGTYTTNYKTPAGIDWDAFFIGLSGNPNGLVNRKDYPTLTHVKSYGTWNNQISGQVGQPAIAQISLLSKYDPIVKCYAIDVTTKFLQASSANYKLTVVLMEDSIVGPQTDYTQNPSTVYNYLFRHVMRGSLNGTWGDAINTSPVVVNDVVTKTISNFNINSTFKDNRLHIIAFIYNSTTYEVIQVEEIKLK